MDSVDADGADLVTSPTSGLLQQRSRAAQLYGSTCPRTRSRCAVGFGHGSARRRKIPAASSDLRTGSSPRGYATLCFDNAGVGQSTGQYSPGESRRTRRGVRGSILRHRGGRGVPAQPPEIVGIASGLPALSGRMVVPLAARRVNAAFMVIIVGPTVFLRPRELLQQHRRSDERTVEEGYSIAVVQRRSHTASIRNRSSNRSRFGLWLLGGEDRSIPTPATVTIPTS